jgi:hypothetical protein
VVYLGLFIYFIGQDVPLALVLIYVTVVGSLLDGVQLMAKKATEAYLAGQKGRSDWGELPAVEIAKDRFQILTGWQG